MYFITVPECVEKLHERHPQEKTVIVLKQGYPLIPQLLSIPDGVDYIVTIPEEWPQRERENLALMVSSAMTCIAFSRATTSEFKDYWAENAFWNYETCISAPPVDKIQKLGDYALIAGSGPSAKAFKPADNAQVFAAWSSPVADNAHFIVHCDHRDQKKSRKTPKQGIIMTPVAAKEFVTTFPNSIAYVYFDRGNPISWRFAEKRQLPDHHYIDTNVVYMMIQCAMYAGHKKIKLIGCDLCCSSPDETFEYHPTVEEVFETQNYRGEIVYTDAVFQSFQQALEEIVRMNPDLEVFILSDKGVIIEGVSYEPVA